MHKKPLVLCLDGSTGVCSVALLITALGPEAASSPLEWEVIDSRGDGDGRSQAKILLRLADAMLRQSGLGAEDLSAVIVGTGPGTFTGVRITVATARALGLSLGIPVLGVSTLAALAAAAAEARPDAAVIAPVVDARRKQVFYGLYGRSVGGAAGAVAGADEADAAAGAAGSGRLLRVAPYSVCDRESLVQTIADEVVAAEDVASPVSPMTLVVGEAGLLDGRLLEGQDRLALEVRAEWLLKGQSLLREPGDAPEGDRLDGFLVGAHVDGGAGAWGRAAVVGGGVSAGDPGTPESVRPIYVRPPDADIHITKMRDPWASQTDAS